MKTISRLFKSLFISLLLAIVLGLAIWTTSRVSVTKGFVFGPPLAQQVMTEDGTYTVKRWGFPATYKEAQLFHASTSKYETSYESRPFNAFLAAVNVVFWMSLLVSALSPIAILFRPKKKAEKPNEAKSTEEKVANEAK